MGYIEELQFAANAPHDAFPEFLFNPLINDFDDNYYEIGISNDPLALKAKSLRKKYSNFFDYIDAIGIYNEYINSLIEKYGSWSIVKNSHKIGVLSEMLPSKPKLKNNKRNREFIRSGIVPSKKIYSIDDDSVVDTARELYPDSFGDDIDEFDRFKKPDKGIRKMLKASSEAILGANRRKNLYSNASSSHGADIIIEYFNQVNKGYYDDKGESHEYSISDICKEEERINNTPPEILEYEDTNNLTTVLNGRVIRKDIHIKAQIIKDLYENGIDILGNMGKHMDKNTVKMIRSSIGAYDSKPMTDKELKKFKKRAKKEQRELDRQKDCDSRLSKILLKNKFSFEKGDNNLSFRLKDIYTSDD